MKVKYRDSVNCKLKKTGGKVVYTNEYAVKYKLNGGKFPKWAYGTSGTGEDNEFLSYVRKGKTVQLPADCAPYRLGYEFQGWYKDKKLIRATTKVKGTKSPKSRTLYAKWARLAGAPYYVRAHNDSELGGTASDVARVNNAMKLLKRRWLKDFALDSGTVTVCNDAYFSHYVDYVRDAAGYYTSPDRKGTSVPHPTIIIRSGSSTNPRLVCHEFGHWYETKYLNKKDVKKLKQLHKRYYSQVLSILGSHAAWNYQESFAELFSALATKSLTDSQKAQLGDYYTTVRALVK